MGLWLESGESSADRGFTPHAGYLSRHMPQDRRQNRFRRRWSATEEKSAIIVAAFVAASEPAGTGSPGARSHGGVRPVRQLLDQLFARPDPREAMSSVSGGYRQGPPPHHRPQAQNHGPDDRRRAKSRIGQRLTHERTCNRELAIGRTAINGGGRNDQRRGLGEW